MSATDPSSCGADLVELIPELNPAAELEHRAWQCLTAAGRPLTASDLAELAGLTRGGALRFLTGWVAAGQARRRAPGSGRYAPYAAVFTAAVRSASC